MFQFESFDALLTMGGHGPYVWAAYGLSLVIMLGLVLSPLRKQRVIMANIQLRIDREKRINKKVTNTKTKSNTEKK